MCETTLGSLVIFFTRGAQLLYAGSTGGARCPNLDGTNVPVVKAAL
jgi:hypothetical protein